MSHRYTVLALVLIVLAVLLVWPLGLLSLFAAWPSGGLSIQGAPVVLIVVLLVACLFAFRAFLRHR